MAMSLYDEYFDDPNDNLNADIQSEKHCKYCGKGNLHWEDDNGKWVLTDSKTNEIHRCKEYEKKLHTTIDNFLNRKIFK